MSWNEDLFRFINQDMANPGLDVFFSILIILGTVYVWLVFVPALWWKGKRNEAVDLFFLILLVLVVTTLLKFLFAAPRPTDIREVPIPVPGYFAYDVYSFPSNHASRAFACALFLSFRFRKWTVPLFVYAFLIALAKVYVGAHYPSDIFAGAVIGLIFGFLFAWLGKYDLYSRLRGVIVMWIEGLGKRDEQSGKKEYYKSPIGGEMDTADTEPSIVCKSCKSSFKLHQPYPIHAGFSDMGYLYCDRDGTIVTWSTFDPVFTSIVGRKHPWTLSEMERRSVEEAMMSCPCGGEFRFKNNLLCPECGNVLGEGIEEDIYFYILGSWIDGEKINIWKRGVIYGPPHSLFPEHP